MSTTVTNVLKDKTLADLVDDPQVSGPAAVNYTQEKVEEALKCLKWQDGCSETEGNEGYIGLGDSQIAKKVGLSVAQVKKIKEDREAKIAALTPNPIDVNN